METVAPTSCAKQETLTEKIDGGALVVVLPAWGNLLENLECFHKNQRARPIRGQGTDNRENEKTSRQVERQPNPAVYTATTHQ
jgi:hypothetical protein